MCIIEPKPISTEYFINLSQQSVRLYVNPLYCYQAAVQLNVSLHSALGNGSKNTSLRNEYTQQQKKYFYCLHPDMYYNI
jgi:hypothetical protein